MKLTISQLTAIPIIAIADVLMPPRPFFTAASSPAAVMIINP